MIVGFSSLAELAAAAKCGTLQPLSLEDARKGKLRWNGTRSRVRWLPLLEYDISARLGKLIVQFSLSSVDLHHSPLRLIRSSASLRESGDIVAIDKGTHIAVPNVV